MHEWVYAMNPLLASQLRLKVNPIEPNHWFNQFASVSIVVDSLSRCLAWVDDKLSLLFPLYRFTFFPFFNPVISIFHSLSLPSPSHIMEISVLLSISFHANMQPNELLPSQSCQKKKWRKPRKEILGKGFVEWRQEPIDRHLTALSILKGERERY